MSATSSRNNRPRSRQCRGSRARNYVRAVTRSRSDAGKRAVLADAEASGALANFRRQQKQALKREAKAHADELARNRGA